MKSSSVIIAVVCASLTGCATSYANKDRPMMAALTATPLIPIAGQKVNIINAPDGPECEKGELMIEVNPSKPKNEGRRLDCSQGFILPIILGNILPEIIPKPN